MFFGDYLLSLCPSELDANLLMNCRLMGKRAVRAGSRREKLLLSLGERLIRVLLYDFCPCYGSILDEVSQCIEQVYSLGAVRLGETSGQ